MPALAHLLAVPAAVALAAWTLVGVGTPATVNATSHPLTEPADVQQGDLLVACIASRIASTTSITLPSGWTRVNESKTNNVVAGATTGIASACMAFIERGASAPALTFTHPTAPSVAQGVIIAYRNLQPASVVDASAAGVTATNTTAVSIAGLTSTIVEDLIVAMTAGGQAALWSNFRATTPATGSGATDATTPPDGTTWRERAEGSTTTGADTSFGVFDAIKTVAGATGNFLTTASLGAGHALVAGAFKRRTSAFDPHRKPSSVALSNSNRTATSSAALAYVRVGLVHGASRGKFYYEFTPTVIGNPSSYAMGLCIPGDPYWENPDGNSWLGNWSGSIAWYPGQSAVYHFNANVGTFAATMVAGNVIGVAYDLDNKTAWWRWQNGNWNGSAGANPATNAGGFSFANMMGIVVPAVCFFNNGDAGTINVGATAFSGAPPSGFKPAGMPS